MVCSFVIYSSAEVIYSYLSSPFPQVLETLGIVFISFSSFGRRLVRLDGCVGLNWMKERKVKNSKNCYNVSLMIKKS